MKRRFEVIADYPFSKFEIGDTLIQFFFETSSTGMYCYVTNTDSPLQGNSLRKDYVECMPHLFKEIDPS